MSQIRIPDDYKPSLNLFETEVAVKMIKDTFERRLAEQLRLTRVSAPLFLFKNTGLNDNLNGVERPVSFTSPALGEENEVEIIHSLAKWKRDALHRYDFKPHTGLYADMNAIRRDEEIDNLHSLYVDQWDWEVVINKEERTKAFFEKIVKRIYFAFLDVEYTMVTHYPQLGEPLLPEKITFVTSQELEDMYPDLTPKERENAMVRAKKAICVEEIGDVLKSGQKHDGRAPDYDDWKLNGDILVYNPVLNEAIELSSMGIRVDAETLKKQLKKANAEDRLKLPFHQNILNGVLPYSIGGGIGQSRICMYFLRKCHIGEVQASLWDTETIEECAKHHVPLL